MTPLEQSVSEATIRSITSGLQLHSKSCQLCF